jgi:hypothetical protein
MKELELNEIFLLDYFVSCLALLLNFLMTLATPFFFMLSEPTQTKVILRWSIL